MPSSQLNVIGLISGGKDSLFSLLHCVANGHNVVALANVYPASEAAPTEGAEDVESYMYQTVGHQVLPLYAQALGLPLFRQPIRGRVVTSRREYMPIPDTSNFADETESLIPLLARVKAAHPHANAVSTGAILSTYQRTRVESVALRLGLIPLSFLWQFPYLSPHRQASLLEDMSAVGQHSIIVKVASGGLSTDFLGRDVAEPKVVSELTSIMSRFGHLEVGNILGEGGEYETLAVDGPAPLWKGKIVPQEQAIVDGGESAILKINNGFVIPKESNHDGEGCIVPRIPHLLDAEFKELLRGLQCAGRHPTTAHIGTACQEKTLSSQPFQPTSMTIKELPGEIVRISNLRCIQRGCSAAAQMRYIVSTVRILLERKWSLSPASIIFSSIILRNMLDFGDVNLVYGSLFQDPNPPARVTIACGDLLPGGVDVVVSLTVYLGRADTRNGLHVQSRSYWAPANIGPYSQAISVPIRPVLTGYVQEPRNREVDDPVSNTFPRMVYVAGQIPLVPISMEMVSVEQYHVQSWNDGQQQPPTFNLQAVLALQHLWRIGRSMNVDWWSGAIAFVPVCPLNEAEERAAVAFRVWNDIHLQQAKAQEESIEDPEEFDVWHVQNNSNYAQSLWAGDVRKPLPNFGSVVGESHGLSTPPCFTIQVQDLPRGASIEWSSTGICAVAAGDIQQQCLFQSDLTLHCCRLIPDGPVISFIGLRTASSISQCTEHLLSWIPQRQTKAEEMIHFFTVYVVPTANDIPWSWIEEHSAEIIPCLNIWQDGETKVEALIVVHTRKKHDLPVVGYH